MSTGLFTIIENGSNSTKLQENLNQELERFADLRVRGSGIGFGDSNPHAGVEIQARNSDNSGAPEVQVWVGGNSGLSSLGEDLDAEVGKMGTVKSLDLMYDKSNEKWRAIVVYLTAGNGDAYRAFGMTNSSGSTLAANVDSAIGTADSAAFGFAYGNSKNGALVIHT